MDQSRRPPFRCSAFLVSVVLLTGCQGTAQPSNGNAVYGDPDVSEPSTSAPQQEVDATAATSTVDVESTAGTAPRPRSSSTTVPRSICEGREGPHPNVAVRKDSSGLILRLVVADRLCFGPRDGITLELAVKNDSDGDIYYDSNRYDAFAIEPAGGAAGARWSEFSCSGPPASEMRGPALALEPGESLRFTARYPDQPGQDRSSSPCHVLDPGDYVVRSVFRTCPEGSRDSGYCDPERVVDIPSATLDIRVMSSE